MVSTFPMNNFFRQPGLTVDTSHAQKYYEEDSNILDESVLDHSALDSGLEMSPPMQDRRDSFAPYFSPKQEDWQSVDMQAVPSNNAFDQHPTNPFYRMEQPHAAAFPQQGAGWAVGPSMSQDFDFSRPLQPPAQFNNPSTTMPLFSPQAATPGSHSIPPSPQHQTPLQQPQQQPQHQQPPKDWLVGGGAGQELKDSGSGGVPKKRQASPQLRPNGELRRQQDGIRKKNARFDIPADRNLSNIDQLIAQSTDDQEVKELKQQKRLLRNRQAALDSRQRKKQHTERLEDEKKQYTTIVADLEEDNSKLEVERNRAVEIAEELRGRSEQYDECFERMNLEKEEMISNHTLETAELRKKISALTEHIQRLEASAAAAATAASMAAAGAGAGPYATSDYGGMEGISMDPSSWESMGFMSEFPLDEVKHEPTPTATASNAVVKKEQQQQAPMTISLSDSDKAQQPGSQGLLCMFLLFGAWVLSRGGAAGAGANGLLPRVSDDVRAASVSFLESQFKDAGLAPPQPSASASAEVVVLEEATDMEGVVVGVASSRSAASMLGDMTDGLVRPTREQANQQLFSLSAADYNSVVGGGDFLAGPERNAGSGSTSGGRRGDLAEALAAVRVGGGGGTGGAGAVAASGKQPGAAADVYSRSVLWDQIPSDVVRSFAKMVAECGSTGDGRHHDP